MVGRLLCFGIAKNAVSLSNKSEQNLLPLSVILWFRLPTSCHAAAIFAWGFPRASLGCMMSFEEFVLIISYLSLVAAFSIVSVVILLALKWRSKTGMGVVSVVVLGDIGRSPRMQYHTLALAHFDFEVDLVGFAGEQAVHAQRHVQPMCD